MNAQRLVWLGVPTQNFDAAVTFFRDIMGLDIEHLENDFAILRLSSGEAVEVFGPTFQQQAQFATGPVVGFQVADVRQARAEMEARGVAFIGPIHEGDNSAAWAHFRGPDGKVYEITQMPKDELKTN